MSETVHRMRSDSVVSTHSVDEDGTFMNDVDDPRMTEELLMAIQSNDVETVKAADNDSLSLPTTAMTYALHEACEHGSFDVVRFLLTEAECDVDIRDAQQWTPLHYAASYQSESPELVHLLLSAGADPKAECEDGDTPLAAYLEEVEMDESDEPTQVMRLLESVDEEDDYEVWAKIHARSDEYTELIKTTRPHYVAAATRQAFALLHANASKHQKDLGSTPEAFLLGAHGGHVCFDHLLPFLA